MTRKTEEPSLAPICSVELDHGGAAKQYLVSIVDEVVEDKDWLTIRSFSAGQVTAQRDPMSPSASSS